MEGRQFPPNNQLFEEFIPDHSNPTDEDEDLLGGSMDDYSIIGYLNQQTIDINDNEDQTIHNNQSYNQNQSPSPNQESDRSNFTQESCSPPESGRIQPLNASNNHPQHKPLSLNDLESKLDQVALNKQSHSFQDSDINASRKGSDFFALQMNQSPSRDSQSFQGQLTSTFPQNLKDSSMMRLRDGTHDNFTSPHLQEELKVSDDEGTGTNRQDQSANDSNRFNNSFQKFEGQRIKDFEKSTLIRFEEFNGGDSQDDSQRKYSERISDRIYEKSDYQRIETPQAANPDDEVLELNQQDNQSPYYRDRQLPLFIITEEEQSEIHSSYQTFNRMQSINSQHERQGSSQDVFMRINSDQSQHFFGNVSRDMPSNQVYQKSKSQPIRHMNSSQAINNRLSHGVYGQEGDTQDKVLRTDTSPTINPKQKHLSPYFNELKLTQGAYNQSRQSTESPLLGPNDNDYISNYFKRMQSNQGHRSSNNVTQPDLIMSDEDLLSNIDRVSKILPTNEISDEGDKFNSHDEERLRQKIKEQKQIIDHLRCENQNKQTLILIKESQMNLLQLKNEQLEEKVATLFEELAQSKVKEVMIDVGIMTDDVPVERQKIRPKKNKQSLSGLKKTPQRLALDLTPDITGINKTMGSLASKQNSTTNVFDTPQIRLDKILRESPSPSGRLNLACLSKAHSVSFTSDDMNQFKQQMVVLRQQIQRSEETNLDLQQRIEKLKKDKQTQKAQLFQLSVDKNDLTRQVEAFKKDQENYQRRFEALKIEIQDYIRQIQILEMKCNKDNMMERKVSAKSLALTIDQHVQTDFIVSQPPKPNKFIPKNNSIKVLDDGFDQQNESSISSTKSIPQQNHITIINNKNDVRQLLDRARDYEQMSLQLQNEINEHRRILRENQEKAMKEAFEQKDSRRRIKKRDAKIKQLRSENAKIDKEKLELQLKLEQSELKLHKLKLKMETKLQEKQIKLMGLKNQIKGYAVPSSGFLTPNTPIANTSFAQQKLYTQSEIQSMINQIIQQQFQLQTPVQQALRNSNPKYRAKSHDLFAQRNVYDLQAPNYYNPENQMFGENPSFSQNDHNNTFSKVDDVFSPHRHYPIQQNLNTSGENSDQIQYIFNSSMKRLNQELESIKQINNRAKSYSNQRDRPKKVRQEPKQNIIYEDSLATHGEQSNPQLVYEPVNPIYNREVIRQLNDKNRCITDSLEQVVSKQRDLSQHHQQRKYSSMQNTQNYRKIGSNANNTPSNRVGQQPINNFDFSELPRYHTNTAKDQDKEINQSVLMDFKPAFENSNIINGSSLNQTQTKLFHPQPIPQLKFETQAPSLNNSMKQPISSMSKHVRLNSNFMTREVDGTISPSGSEANRKLVIQHQNEQRNESHNVDDNKTNGIYESRIKRHPRREYEEMNIDQRSTIIGKYSTNQPRIGGSSQTLGNYQTLPINQSRESDQGCTSTLSNHSHKLEDLKKRYGRLN